jgi:hypothetical protein
VKGRRQGGRKEGGDKPGADAPELFAAGFAHKGGVLWSRDGVVYGKQAALQIAWNERLPHHDTGEVRGSSSGRELR